MQQQECDVFLWLICLLIDYCNRFTLSLKVCENAPKRSFSNDKISEFSGEGHNPSQVPTQMGTGNPLRTPHPPLGDPPLFADAPTVGCGLRRDC